MLPIPQVSFPLDPANGMMESSCATYDPKGGKAMQATTKAHVNHSNNDASTIAERQADPHSHAIVLDPICGCIAYVPDLGCDLIRQFFFNKSTGQFTPLSEIKSGLGKGVPDGPRYIEWHPVLPMGYVINELSSSVAVFQVDFDLIRRIERRASETNGFSDGSGLGEFANAQTMTMVQNIDTVPAAFPLMHNTCGRIATHPSGNFVVVSNRGHDSLAIFKVAPTTSRHAGRLSQLGFFHTRGSCPRHFTFEESGQFLLVANQDSDSISVFHFNMSTGEISFTGNQYYCPSPNFICNVPHQDDWDTQAALETAAAAVDLLAQADGPGSAVVGSGAVAYDPTRPRLVAGNAGCGSGEEESLSAQLSRAQLELGKAQQEIAALRAQQAEQAAAGAGVDGARVDSPRPQHV